jgi:hypothetical protein
MSALFLIRVSKRLIKNDSSLNGCCFRINYLMNNRRNKTNQSPPKKCQKILKTLSRTVSSGLIVPFETRNKLRHK